MSSMERPRVSATGQVSFAATKLDRRRSRVLDTPHAFNRVFQHCPCFYARSERAPFPAPGLRRPPPRRPSLRVHLWCMFECVGR